LFEDKDFEMERIFFSGKETCACLDQQEEEEFVCVGLERVIRQAEEKNVIFVVDKITLYYYSNVIVSLLILSSYCKIKYYSMSF